MIIEINKPYSTKELAQILNVSNDYFKRKRQQYENHLELFYEYEKGKRGNAIIYTFTKQLADYIPLKEFKKIQKNSILIKKIKETIEFDNRQTGSNIARIIEMDDEIIPLGLALSSLTIYTRQNLKLLVELNYYSKSNRAWCILNHNENKYMLMSDEEIHELRTFFKSNDDKIAEAYAELQEGNLTRKAAEKITGTLVIDAFTTGLKRYADSHNGSYPIYVPVYERCAWVTDEMVEEALHKEPPLELNL